MEISPFQKAMNELRRSRSVIFGVSVVPHAKNLGYIGVLDDGIIKIGVKCAPEKGKANQELIAYLAIVFGVSKRHVSILYGHTTRRKTVKIETRESFLRP